MRINNLAIYTTFTGSSAKNERGRGKGAENSIWLNTQQKKPTYSLNLFQYFQPGFPLPTFHRGNKVDQSHNLAFTVFLQMMGGCLVKTQAIRQHSDARMKSVIRQFNDAAEKELFLPGAHVPSAHILSPEGSKPSLKVEGKDVNK